MSDDRTLLERAAQESGVSVSDAASWLRNRSAIIEAIRSAGLLLVGGRDGYRLLPIGRIKAQGATAKENRNA